MKGLAGKRVLVTGATSGIGQAIALRLAEEGARVALNFRRGVSSVQETDALLHEALGLAPADNLERHAAVDEGSHMLVKADVSNAEDVVAMVAEVIAGLGGLDILINNAGIQIPAASHEATVEDFDRVLAVNLRGAFVAAREAIRHFLAREAPG